MMYICTHGTDSADEYLLHYFLIQKNLTRGKRQFGYITDVSEKLIHADRDTISSFSDETDISTPTPPKQAPKKDTESQLDRKIRVCLKEYQKRNIIFVCCVEFLCMLKAATHGTTPSKVTHS
jgi:hypothetical protein